MRRTGAIASILVAAVGCGAESQPPAAPTQETAEGAGVVPAWVPAASPQQAALLTPVQRTIKAPAARIFPDLERFGYANNRRLASDADATKFTRMVTQVLNDSARFYALGELPPGAANPIVQYGPLPAEPDGFKIVKRSGDGIGQLVPAQGAEEARVAVAQSVVAAKQGDPTAAIEALRAAVARTPTVPALRVALAATIADAGRAGEAESAYREAVAVDPTFAPVHFALAELAYKRGDRRGARRALAEGLALHPASVQGLELLGKLGPSAGGIAGAEGGWYDAPKDAGAANAGRAEPFLIFLDVDTAGAIHVATGKSDAAQIYGGCRAVMRHEPQLRAQIFQQPAETPYYLSVAEEVVCLEAGLGAYLASKADRTDPELEQLLRIARDEGLSGYVMFEILGQHRPERARTAPSDVHRDTVAYLEHWVLTRREPIPEGVYTARR